MRLQPTAQIIGKRAVIRFFFRFRLGFYGFAPVHLVGIVAEGVGFRSGKPVVFRIGDGTFPSEPFRKNGLEKGAARLFFGEGDASRRGFFCRRPVKPHGKGSAIGTVFVEGSAGGDGLVRLFQKGILPVAV